jgi:hypothetical protein
MSKLKAVPRLRRHWSVRDTLPFNEINSWRMFATDIHTSFINRWFNGRFVSRPSFRVNRRLRMMEID